MTTKTFDPTKPVQTRDGRKARIICTDGESGTEDKYRIWALVTCHYKDYTREYAYPYDSNGRLDIEAGNHPLDLVNVTVKTSTWQNLYSGRVPGIIREFRTSYSTYSKDQKFLGRLRLDYEDGVFVKAEFEPAEDS